MPYKGVGMIKNATIDAVVGLDIDGSHVVARVYTTAEQPAARLVLEAGGIPIIDERFDGSPRGYQEFHATIPAGVHETQLQLTAYDNSGLELVKYQPKRVDVEIPSPAQAIPEPKQLDSNESLFLAGLHLEQYRHATRKPEHYFREALAARSGRYSLQPGARAIALPSRSIP